MTGTSFILLTVVAMTTVCLKFAYYRMTVVCECLADLLIVSGVGLDMTS